MLAVEHDKVDLRQYRVECEIFTVAGMVIQEISERKVVKSGG
jgi:hypothetical protein